MSGGKPTSDAVSRAAEMVRSGDVEGAILRLEEAAELRPDDTRVWLNLAALRHEQGAQAASVDAYARAAVSYVDQGQGLKAIAVYKQAIRIAPKRGDLVVALAHQYQRHGLVAEAMQQYLLAMELYSADGRPLDCMDLLRDALALDPDNLPDRVRLAEAYTTRGRLSDAAGLLREVLQSLDSQAHPELFADASRRLLFQGEPSLEVAVALARHDLHNGHAGDALHHLRRAHQMAPENTDVLELVAQVFDTLGQDTRALAVSRHQASIYEKSGLLREAEAVRERMNLTAPEERPPPSPPPGS